jgi:aerobic-type carbon monoxide dehydrogenase small subunit (CoxS/CutS family)
LPINHQNGTIPIELTVNGREVSLEIPPQMTLLDLLRDRLSLKGVKRSCDLQVCGACTILVDGHAVSSCTYLAYEARGADVLTIEGLADGNTSTQCSRHSSTTARSSAASAHLE